MGTTKDPAKIFLGGSVKAAKYTVDRANKDPSKITVGRAAKDPIKIFVGGTVKTSKYTVDRAT